MIFEIYPGKYNCKINQEETFKIYYTAYDSRDPTSPLELIVKSKLKPFHKIFIDQERYNNPNKRCNFIQDNLLYEEYIYSAILY